MKLTLDIFETKRQLNRLRQRCKNAVDHKTRSELEEMIKDKRSILDEFMEKDI